ncbi:probable esterase PIR7A [Cajanus cajan]|uniref:Esterase PIR7A n=1 Tax=Cajanus cajan TaxID=3821 RepID=A0A151R3Y4_CAJCA|nr:probable esterase PIR7A [Cajanus cajan]KYP37318.1 putative esterase PIR7A [Cajanus cajan]
MKMLNQERYFVMILVLLFHCLCVNGKHFVLVHGALHGAWCWHKVATHLKSSGHDVTTLDMAASGINPRKREEVDSVAKYHEPLMSFMASLPPKEKVILVGHSLGGLSVSIAMENYPEKISVAVFATAVVVTQKLTYIAYNQELTRRLGFNIADQQYFILNGTNSYRAPILSSLGVEFLTNLYKLSPPEDLTLAFSLVRPLPPFSSNVKLLKEQTAVTNYKNGRVPKIFIISGKDSSLTEDFQRWTIENTGPYAEVKVIKDSDHMVMSSEPKELSYELIKIAYKY